MDFQIHATNKHLLKQALTWLCLSPLPVLKNLQFLTSYWISIPLYSNWIPFEVSHNGFQRELFKDYVSIFLIHIFIAFKKLWFFSSLKTLDFLWQETLKDGSL